MDELRLILLIIGAILIVLIYLWGIRKQIKARLAEKRRRRIARGQPPSLNNQQENNIEAAAADTETPTPAPSAVADTDAVQTDEAPTSVADGSDITPPTPTPAIESEAQTPFSEQPTPQVSSERRKPAPGPRELNIMVTVMAPQGRFFTGAEIKSSCHDLELLLNDKGVWDYFMDSEIDKDPVFGVAHLKEPGTFDATAIEGLSTPGLLLFSALPGPSKAVAVVDLMLATAGQFARRLGGTVCDERRNKMSPQAMIYMRTEAAEFDQRMQDEAS